jgi:small subunit ribosomal protein S1
MADDLSMNPTRDDFAALLDESMGGSDFAEGTVVKGLVVGIEKELAIIDVGLKTEGRIPVKEFGVDDDGKATLKVGDTVEVFLERIENALGEAVISRDKARREEAWTRLEGVFAKNEPVMGAIVGRVKGGFTVDLGGASAFLPGSQVDIRPVRDVGPLMARNNPSRSSRWTARAAISWSRAAPSSRKPAPNNAPNWSASSSRARCAKAWSRTSPTTGRSWTSAVSMACCTSPT